MKRDRVMADARIMNGRELASIVRKQIKAVISQANVRAPKLVVVLVGNHPASLTYVKAKERAGLEIGLNVELVHLSENITPIELKRVILAINHDSSVDGAIIQLPLPSHLQANECLNWLDPKKDVDGLSALNLGKLVNGDASGLLPCTPKGIVRILKHYQIETKGKLVTIIGRSTIVGRPLSILLSHSAWGGHATVTLAHSHSADLIHLCSQADILICAAGSAKLIRSEFIKPNATVIDVGIHKLADNTLCGDVDFASAKEQAGLITPVPGGVGPMTVAMLLQNCMLAWKRHFGLAIDDEEIL
jgi:methylenetetrahydrofolate dehydrogenase (NADP+)/methenyltetrahydrofolate cyclohydrolase